MAQAPTLSTDQLREEIHAALAAGVLSEREILSMVATATPPAKSNQYEPEDLDPAVEGIRIYTELPPGLIDLPSAAKKYDSKVGRFQNWVNRGYLQVHGRLRAPASGGGYLVVNEADLVAQMALAATRRGRPRKK
jgi:hypothetical protein